MVRKTCFSDDGSKMKIRFGCESVFQCVKLPAKPVYKVLITFLLTFIIEQHSNPSPRRYHCRDHLDPGPSPCRDHRGPGPSPSRDHGSPGPSSRRDHDLSYV